jgi:hypothetical protein
MSNSKKFGILLLEEGTTWTAQITRRKTARETIVSKSETGFESEALAQAWADEAIKVFLETVVSRNNRR